jgi:Bacterial transcriptional regulator
VTLGAAEFPLERKTPSGYTVRRLCCDATRSYSWRAGGPRSRDSDFPRHAPATITKPDRLPTDLESMREQECATSVDELEVGLSAVAAPVRGARGGVIAALSISGPTLRMTEARIRELRPILISEAGALSRRLGYREQGERAA